MSAPASPALVDHDAANAEAKSQTVMSQTAASKVDSAPAAAPSETKHARLQSTAKKEDGVLTQIRTPRLLLRRAAMDDLTAIHAILSNGIAMRYWSCLPHTSPEQSRDRKSTRLNSSHT